MQIMSSLEAQQHCGSGSYHELKNSVTAQRQRERALYQLPVDQPQNAQTGRRGSYAQAQVGTIVAKS